jgi:hypothetical protein
MPPPPMLLVATETEPQLALSGDGGGGDAAAGELGLPHSLLSNPFLSPRCAAAACRQIAAQHQLPSQLGAFPWAANNGQTGPGPPAKVESEVEPAARAEAETEHKEEDRPPSKRPCRKANQGGSSEPRKPLPILPEEHTGEVNELFSVALGNTSVAQHESGTRAHPPYVHDCTVIIQGPQLAYCMLDPYGEIQAAAKKLNLPDLRKRAEFRKLALLKGRPYPWFCPLGVGKGKDRPQNNIVQEVAACLQLAGYSMPTEEELIAKGWWGSTVGVLHMTGTAEEGDPRWNALGRWTRDIGKWKAPNIFDDLSFTLEKSLRFENRPYGPSVKLGKTATGLLKRQCESIWMSKVCEVREEARAEEESSGRLGSSKDPLPKEPPGGSSPKEPPGGSSSASGKEQPVAHYVRLGDREESLALEVRCARHEPC